MTTAVYPGSFDPLTLGHIDIVTRASRLFDKVILAIVKNPGKQPFFSLEQRLQLGQDCLKHLPNIEVQSFEGLTVEFAKQNSAKVLIRGLRAISDFEFEFMMSQMNKTLESRIETVFMMASMEYQFMSSSMVKEVALLGGDVSSLVPKAVLHALNTRQPANEGSLQ